MASERDLELLDDYISNRLTGTDKEYIEKRLEQDPDLRSEYNIQQQVASGLRKARAAQLKQMLNNIPTPPAYAPGSPLTRIAGAGIVVLITLSVAYFFWKSEPRISSPAAPAPQEEPAEVPSSSGPVRENETLRESVEPAVKPQENPQTETAGETAESPSDKEKRNRINVFDPSAEQDLSQEPVIPESSEATTPTTTMKVSEMIVETDDSNRKYSFHYQVKDGKLILYGPFEKNLYEILEFFTSEKRTVFLFYRDTYYLLSTDAEKITPLIPVNDPNLLAKLRQFRGSAR